MNKLVFVGIYESNAGAGSAARLAGAYSEELKAAVWRKAQPIPGWNPDDCRLDHDGNPLFRPHYGNRRSPLGWKIVTLDKPSLSGRYEIAHLCPVALNGRKDEPW